MCICHQSIITRVTLVMSKATIISDKCKLSSAMERRQTLGLRGWSGHHLHDRSLSLHGSPEVADFQLQRLPHQPHRPLPAPAQVSLVSLVVVHHWHQVLFPSIQVQSRRFLPTCNQLQEVLLVPGHSQPGHGGSYVLLPAGGLGNMVDSSS